MIFDLLDPLRIISAAKIPLLFIGLTFVADFYHMTINLDAENKKNTNPWLAWLDALISILFCFAYFVLAPITKKESERIFPIHIYCLFSLILLAATHLLIVLYEVGFSRLLNKRNFLRLFPFIICCVGAFVVYFFGGVYSERSSLYVTIAVTSLSFIIYEVYVIYWWKLYYGNQYKSAPDIVPTLSVNNCPGDKEMVKEKQKNDSKLASEYFECYAEFSKTLRTWFIAYGIGAPVLFLSNKAVWETIKSSGNIGFIGLFFLFGISIQTLEALLYKNAMWYLYRGEENPQIKNKKRYKFFYNISEYYWLEILFDLLTLGFFATATWKVVCILI
jgi:hypothetical protein